MTTSAAPSTFPAPIRSRVERQDYVPMVRRIAMRLARRLPQHIAVADLVSAGWVGLMEAVSRSASDMPEEEFVAYASHRVRGAMLDYLRQLDPASRQARYNSRRIAYVISKQTQLLGRTPSDEEVAAALGMEIDEYRVAAESMAKANATRLDVLDSVQLDALPAANEGPDQLAERSLLGATVTEAVSRLPKRLQQVLALYYQEGCTLREIGAVLDVSESRVCQLHSEAMNRLRVAVGA
jgi:RNA polymerase sigma factor for flagellar operon FliA